MMHMRPRRGSLLISGCVLGAIGLLASCTGSPGRGPFPAAAGGAVTPAKALTSSCSQPSSGVIGFEGSPDLGAGTRVVLGSIAVATGYAQRPVPLPGGPWRYWQKHPVKVRAGTGPVQVSVPPSWRHRVAITYGPSGTVSSLMLTACRQPSGVWDAYAGGLYLSADTSCVPLVFTTGSRSVTVRLSMAGRCR